MKAGCQILHSHWGLQISNNSYLLTQRKEVTESRTTEQAHICITSLFQPKEPVSTTRTFTQTTSSCMLDAMSVSI
jgi:hypothetical protein